MALSQQKIEKLLHKNLPGAVFELHHLGDDDHYSLYVEHNSFEGISRIEQHRKVYAALDGLVGEELHALALQTAIPSKKQQS